ncbi:unnamed protein product [Mytilus edulis]|uniref:DZIP3-like HEPN domain-containing protein n=1 Tax=Mytilus edulis TaxID=6550 RepID=A0A8S3R8H9_MYTED|nr:unnamed protein product [Mytilus edulis]
MWISDKSCRSCCNGVMPLAEGFLRKDDIDFLYQKSTNDDDPSCYFANQGISTANLAPRLSYILLQALSNEIKVSNRLRKCRNDIAHRASLTLKANDFDQMWNEISTMLLQLSYVYGGEQDVSTKLQILKTEGTAENFEILLANVQRVLKEDEQLDKLQAVMKAYHCDILSSLHEEFGNMKAFFKQFQPVNESNSSNEKRRKIVKLKVEAQGTEINVITSTAEYTLESNSEQTDNLNEDSSTAMAKPVLKTCPVSPKEKERTTEKHYALSTTKWYLISMLSLFS